jgi:hypothetical protein
MEQVEGITKHSSDISSASQASLGTVIDQLTQIITNNSKQWDLAQI